MLALMLTAVLLPAPQTNAEVWKHLGAGDPEFAVRVERADVPQAVWLRLTNRTKGDLAFCVDDVKWTYSSASDEMVSGGWVVRGVGGGPCDIPRNWHRLLPGETYFLRGEIEGLSNQDLLITAWVRHGGSQRFRQSSQLGTYNWTGRP